MKRLLAVSLVLLMVLAATLSYAGIPFMPTNPCHVRMVKVRRIVEVRNSIPTATCEVDRQELLPGESVRVRAVASDTDNDTLTYDWRASAGRIVCNGSIVCNGPVVTFDSSSLTPPARAVITLHVSDNRGGIGEAECPVQVAAPPAPKPEAVTCTSGDFPLNVARLNNVNKACLDDVTTRLKSDPRSRVVIKGHADRNERSPSALAFQRAQAVQDYLIKGGIEAARIEIRSSPLVGRTVEVIFVPEGAEVP